MTELVFSVKNHGGVLNIQKGLKMGGLDDDVPQTLQTHLLGKKGAAYESALMRPFWTRKDALWTQKYAFWTLGRSPSMPISQKKVQCLGIKRFDRLFTQIWQGFRLQLTHANQNYTV